MRSLEFARVARQIGQAARRCGCVVPAFRSPSVAGTAGRTIRRRADGSATVLVPLRDRPLPAIVADMIDGVVVANELTPPEATPVRDALWASVVDLIDADPHHKTLAA